MSVADNLPDAGPARRPDAAVAGLACSMRCFAGPAALGARGVITGRARTALSVIAAGELVQDKLPIARDRIEPPGLAGRIVAGAVVGRAIAGARGASVAAVAAAAGTYATYYLRRDVVARTGLPDPVYAVLEDLAAYGLVAIATR